MRSSIAPIVAKLTSLNKPHAAGMPESGQTECRRRVELRRPPVASVARCPQASQLICTVAVEDASATISSAGGTGFERTSLIRIPARQPVLVRGR